MSADSSATAYLSKSFFSSRWQVTISPISASQMCWYTWYARITLPNSKVSVISVHLKHVSCTSPLDKQISAIHAANETADHRWSGRYAPKIVTLCSNGIPMLRGEIFYCVQCVHGKKRFAQLSRMLCLRTRICASNRDNTVHVFQIKCFLQFNFESLPADGCIEH